jgi:hypothetical protein
MRPRLRYISLALLAGSALVLTNAVPSSFDRIGPESAFAKGKGSGKSGGKGGGNSSKSSNAKGKSGGGNGQSAAASGKNKLGNPTGLASVQIVKPTSAGKPKAVVRQYVLETGLKQGDVASMLKSWNSLNRNEQAYLNNMDNPNSLPGRQIAYVRESTNAQAAFAEFQTLGGDPNSPPPEPDPLATQALIGQFNAWTAYQEADPTDAVAKTDLLGAFEALGGDPTSPPTEEDIQAAEAAADLYTAWTDYQAAEASAEDAFLSASVSYNADAYDEAIFGELRRHVDAIVHMKGLDTLVAEFDAVAATGEDSDPGTSITAE